MAAKIAKTLENEINIAVVEVANKTAFRDDARSLLKSIPPLKQRAKQIMYYKAKIVGKMGQNS